MNPIQGVLRAASTQISKAFVDYSFDTQNLGSFVSWLKNANKWNTREQIDQYSNSGYAYMCISAIAEAVGGIDLFTEQKQSTTGKHKRLKTSPIVDILDNPGNGYSMFTLIEMTQAYIELSGEAFWYVAKGTVTNRPKEIFMLRPDQMKVSVDDDGIVTGFTLVKDNGDQIPFTPEEIVHFKMPNPMNPYRGLGTMQVASNYVRTEQYASQWTMNYMLNNGTPSGIVSIDGTITEGDFQSIKRKWSQEYEGTQNAGKTAFLRKSQATFTQIGGSMADIALKDLKGVTLNDIMSMFRVSKPILGIFDDVNLASSKTAFYVFNKAVVDPKMNRIVDTLNQQFVPMFGDDRVILDYVSPVPQDMTERIEYWNAGLNKFLTMNEVREEQGLKPLAGGDTIYIPINVTPLNPESANDPMLPENTPGVSEPEDDDPNAQGGQGGDSEGSDADPGDSQKGQKKRYITVKKKTLDFNNEQKEAFRSAVYKTVDGYDAKLRSILIAQLEKILDSALTVINRRKGVRKDIDQANIDVNEEAATYASNYQPLVLDLMLKQGQEAMKLVGSSDTYEITAATKEYVATRVDMFATPFFKQLQKELTDVLASGLSNGESNATIAKNVKALIQDDYEKYQSVRVARTETSAASNRANVEAWKQTGYVTGKEWYANPDACTYCRELSGDTISLDGSFAELGTSVAGYQVDYTAIEEPPLHPNCECTAIPVTKSYDELITEE